MHTFLPIVDSCAVSTEHQTLSITLVQSSCDVGVGPSRFSHREAEAQSQRQTWRRWGENLAASLQRCALPAVSRRWVGGGGQGRLCSHRRGGVGCGDRRGPGLCVVVCGAISWVHVSLSGSAYTGGGMDVGAYGFCWQVL